MILTILNYIDKTFSGSIVTLTDLQIELSKYFDVRTSLKFFKLLHTKEYKKLINIKDAVDKYCLINYSVFNDFIEDDIIITSYYALKNIQLNTFKCKHLIILDSLDVYDDISNSNIDLLNDLDCLKCNVYLFFNTFNINTFKKYNINFNNIIVKEYFSKISKDRVLKLGEKIVHNKILVRDEKLYDSNKELYFLYNNRYSFLNTLEFKGFSFSRMKHMEKYFVENIGKLFFEYLYLDREVNYFANNKIIDDGMHYYLKKINVDSNINHINIKINKSILEEHIFFNKNDELIQFLKGLSNAGNFKQ